jgi:EAL domain-containing protein (putative c-di-GMP-specific phosphodiesterase class I)
MDGLIARSTGCISALLAMVESINRIGSLMEIETIAEFAETDEIISNLNQIDVDYAQGYGVQHPVSADEFLATV